MSKTNEIEVWKLKTKIFGSVLLFILVITLIGSLTGVMETAFIYTVGMSLFAGFMGVLMFFSYLNYRKLSKVIKNV